MRKTLLVITAVAMALAARPARAHHAFAAEYDEKKVTQLRGTVTKLEWANPHTMIHLNVINADGSVTEWRIEGNAPNSLLRAGVTKKSLEPGNAIVVRGYLAKSGENKASGSSITLPDGRTLSLGSPYDDPRHGDSSDEAPLRIQLDGSREQPANQR